MLSMETLSKGEEYRSRLMSREGSGDTSGSQGGFQDVCGCEG